MGSKRTKQRRKHFGNLLSLLALVLMTGLLTACPGDSGNNNNNHINPYYPGGQQCPPYCGGGGMYPPLAGNVVSRGVGWASASSHQVELALQVYSTNYNPQGTGGQVTAAGTLAINQPINGYCYIPAGRYQLQTMSVTNMGIQNIYELRMESLSGQRLQIYAPLLTITTAGQSRMGPDGQNYVNKIMGLMYFQSLNGQSCSSTYVNFE
jgi:hypothetical protein